MHVFLVSCIVTMKVRIVTVAESSHCPNRIALVSSPVLVSVSARL